MRTSLSLIASATLAAAIAAPGIAAPPGTNTDVAVGDPATDQMCLYVFSEEVESDDPNAEDGETETISYWAELGTFEYGGPLTMWPPNHKPRDWQFSVAQSGDDFEAREMPVTSADVDIVHNNHASEVPVDSFADGAAYSEYIDADGETRTEGDSATTMEFVDEGEEIMDARGGVALDFFGHVLSERDGQDRDGRTYVYSFDIDMSFTEITMDDMDMEVMTTYGGDCVLAAKDGEGGYVLDTNDDEYLDDPDEDPQVISDRRTRTAYVPAGDIVLLNNDGDPQVVQSPVITTIEGEIYESFIPHDMRNYKNPNSNAGGKKADG